MRKKKQNTNRRSKSWEDRESRDMKRDDRRISKDSTNDPSWYGADPALLRDSASVPFSWPLGRPISLGTDDGGNKVVPYQAGIATFTVYPAIGEASKITSPINVAAQSMYSFIRHANSGSKNYDAPDLMIYCIAMSEIYSALNWAMRLYGYATAWNQRNRFMPRELITANGVDPDSIINNLANFRMALNVFINKISGMAVPANMSIFARKAFLYQNVYCESLDIKDQLYQFAPMGFYQFDLDSQSRGYLKWKPLITPITTYQGVIDYISDLFQAVWDQEDFGIMSGDILRAYGDNIIKLASIDENYTVLPVFDRLVNLQFKNATICGGMGMPNIIQDPTYAFLQYENLGGKPYIGQTLNKPGARAAYYDKILTIDSPSPTPEEIVEATRLMLTYDELTDNNDCDYMNLYCGTEIISSVVCTIMLNDGTFTRELGNYRQFYSNTDSKISDVWTLTQFKYAPLVYAFTAAETSATKEYKIPANAKVIPLCNVDNFALFRNQDIRKVHEAAILNMLNVPSIAKNAISQK